ncbi:MAG: hypothetical protein ACXWRA_10030 [Pseudobdellovibrionaceae bacterium]
MAVEESITNYFSYVKNVLGVKTIQSAGLRQSLEAGSEASVAPPIQPAECDVLFLNLKQASEQSIFARESAELLEKMIQAMRLGNRRHLILEGEFVESGNSRTEIMQHYTQKVTTPFVVLFSAKPSQNAIQNLGKVNFLESFSPSYLLQNPSAKKVAWADLQRVMKAIGVE